MDFIGEMVRHKTFGSGIIEKLDKEYIFVRFSPEKISKFKFPDAFVQGFLSATNSMLDQYIQRTLSDKKCDICGEENVETELIDGNRLCQKCKAKLITTCSICGRTYIMSLSQFVSNYEDPQFKTPICENCANNTSFTCRVCGHRYLKEYMAPQTLQVGEVPFCKECNDLVITSGMYDKYCSGKSMTFRLSENDTLYVLANDECYYHDTFPAVVALELNTDEVIFLEGQYCNECKQVQITRNTCAFYRRYHEAMKCSLVVKGLDDADDEKMGNDVVYEYRGRTDQSKLRILGYSVSQNNSQTDAERQEKLKRLIYTNQVTKSYVIWELKNLIRINGQKQTNAVARMKWERDLRFVLDL